MINVEILNRIKEKQDIWHGIDIRDKIIGPTAYHLLSQDSSTKCALKGHIDRSPRIEYIK